MPRGDGTPRQGSGQPGPSGAGPGTGSAGSRQAGRGMGMGQGQGRGRMGGFAMGPGGNCVCPSCGKAMPHRQGTPCNQVKCAACGATMTLER